MKNPSFSQFVPKEPKFFPLSKQLSGVLCETSVVLIESLQHDSPAEHSDYYKEVKDLKQEGDRLIRPIFDELGTTFIIPFDHEDIHDLAPRVDDVIDGINGYVRWISVYNPHPISENGRELSHLIQKEAIYICRAMDELEIFRKKPTLLREYCSKLHKIESQADDVYEFFITGLFGEEKNYIKLIKIKEVVHGLGKTTDAAGRVDKILKNLIVKYI